MNQKMIQPLPATLTNATPFHYSISSPCKIVTSKNLPPCHRANKKRHFVQPSLPKYSSKGRSRGRTPSKYHKMNECQTPDSSSTSKAPVRPISTCSPREMITHQMKKISHQIHLSITKVPREPYIPHMYLLQFGMLCQKYQRSSCLSKKKKIREAVGWVKEIVFV